MRRSAGKAKEIRNPERVSGFPSQKKDARFALLA
jgi:hypothetical protein